MNKVPRTSSQSNKARWTALIVLLLTLAVTLFGWWRERELAQRDQTILLQDGLSKVDSLLAPQLGARFEVIHTAAKNTLQRDGVSRAIWNDFVKLSEWRQFPGMLEIGYAEIVTNADKHDDFIIQFLAARSPSMPIHMPGNNLADDLVVQTAIQKSLTVGYGVPSHAVAVGSGSNRTYVVIGLLPLRIQTKPSEAQDDNHSNLRGFVFFALNQMDYFQSLQPQLAATPLNLRLLAENEPLPIKTPTQRAFTITTPSGEWRILATSKAPAIRAKLPQWIVLGGGTGLSFLLFFMFSAQARLRHEAELSNAQILARDEEIMAFNRDLEQKISVRTAELNEALTEEKELGRLKDNFISMVSHEIRTPLSLILSSSEILARYLDRLPPDKRQRQIDTINQAVSRMSNLMEDVLLFSRAEAGRMEFNPIPMDLISFCRQLIDEVNSATNQRCPLHLTLSEVKESARADEAVLRHILMNLLSNAVKYSPVGSPVIFRVERAKGEAVFTIQDQGLGIPEEDRQRLFTAFYRGKNVATIQGTGLGLVIVQRCVERHGGRLEINSREGNGTTAIVRLPLFSPAHTEFIHKIIKAKPPASK